MIGIQTRRNGSHAAEPGESPDPAPHILKVLIADDERLCREALRAQLQQFADIAVVAECADGATALTVIERDQPDLAFLDVTMPRLDGLEVVRRLEPEARPEVIFVTASDEHAVHAFEAQALDYVLKPVDDARLAAVLEHARVRVRQKELSTKMESLLELARSRHTTISAAATRRILVRHNGYSFFVATPDIDWIEALGNYVRLHVGSRTHVVTTSMADLERKLDPDEFMRIHRSTIVNLDRVKHVEPYGGSDYQVVLRDGTKLRVSRSCRDRLLRES